MAPQTDRLIDRVLIFALFGAALITHFYLATINWSQGCLPGHEFRQTQTAIISYYIDQENNFSPHYSTPIMGKPWEIPLEFPLYEWCVVWLSRATGWAQVIAARTISLTSFYLSLPAIYLLLGQVGLTRVRRLLGVALVLVTPVYIFYSRAFLIDPMAFMWSVWFLALFVETMRKRRVGLLVACAICGTAAGLIKSLVLFAWLFPAAIYGAYCLWQDLKERRGKLAIAKTLAWGLGTVLAPAIAMTWWVRMTDAIKAQHSSAYIFTSQSLSHDNYGTFSLWSRMSFQTWKEFFARWQESIAQPWVIIAMVGLGFVFLKRERWRIAAATALFIAAQLLIPYAYAGQDYYYYICAAFVVLAFGFVLNGVLDSGLPRWSRWILVLLPFVALLHAHQQAYFKIQSVKSPGGTALTNILRDSLPSRSVIVVAGDDWSAIIPFYSRHRALMIRNGLEVDASYLAHAFDDLKGEDVAALVLLGDQRKNLPLLDRAASVFGIDRAPIFSWADSGDVYAKKLYRADVIAKVRSGPVYEHVSIAKDLPSPSAIESESLPPDQMAVAFRMIQPTPTAFRLRFGYGTSDVGGAIVLNAHPDSDIWVPVSPDNKTVELAFGIRSEAYEKEGGKTNGVSFEVDAEASNGTTRNIFSRILNPVAHPEDRGLQTTTCELHLVANEKLVLRTRPYGDYSYDWAYWAKVTVK